MDNIIEIVILLILGTIFGIELFNLFIPIPKSKFALFKMSCDE